MGRANSNSYICFGYVMAVRMDLTLITTSYHFFRVFLDTGLEVPVSHDLSNQYIGTNMHSTYPPSISRNM